MNSAESAPILAIKDLCFAYPGQPPLLAGWSATITAGLTHLYGDDGSGKSTLLRLLAGRLTAATGQLRLAGSSSTADLKACQRSVFFVDPETDEFDALTATECTARLRAGDGRFDDARWKRCVDGFSLAPHLGKPMYMLSTGSKRKVWLAAALASGRPLTLLDEPTAALDNASIRCLWRALGELAESSNGRAIVVASAAPLGAGPLSALIELPLPASRPGTR